MVRPRKRIVAALGFLSAVIIIVVFLVLSRPPDITVQLTVAEEDAVNGKLLNQASLFYVAYPTDAPISLGNSTRLFGATDRVDTVSTLLTLNGNFQYTVWIVPIGPRAVDWQRFSERNPGVRTFTWPVAYGENKVFSTGVIEFNLQEYLANNHLKPDARFTPSVYVAISIPEVSA